MFLRKEAEIQMILSRELLRRSSGIKECAPFPGLITGNPRNESFPWMGQPCCLSVLRSDTRLLPVLIPISSSVGIKINVCREFRRLKI